MRRNNFSLVLKKIRDDCIEWNEDGKNFYHQEILLRDEQAHSLKEKIRYIISFFMFPIFKNKKKIYFFQGLRHANYFQHFDKSSIFSFKSVDSIASILFNTVNLGFDERISLNNSSSFITTL